MINKHNIQMVKQWDKSGKLLSQIRKNDNNRIKISDVIENLDEAFQSALLSHPARKTSGLIEMHRLFRLLSK